MKLSVRRLISGFLSATLLVVSAFPSSILSAADYTPVGTLIEDTSKFTIQGNDGGTPPVSVKINDIDISTLPADYQVHDGDNLKLFFDWSLNEGVVESDEKFTIKYDLNPQLNGIKIPDKSYPIGDEDSDTKATYRIIDNVLYIEIEKHLTSNIKGSGMLEGELSYDNAEGVDDGKFDFRYLETTKPLLFSDYVPKLSVSKYASELRYSGGSYYVDYTIEVKNGGMSDAKNVQIKDVFPTGAGALFEDQSFDFTITPPSGASYIVPGTNGGTVDIGDVKAADHEYSYGTPTKITYSLKIDETAAANKSLSYDAKKNTVYAEDDKGRKAQAEAAADVVSAPSVSKSGIYNKNTTDPKITWTVKVDPGIYSKKDDVDFSVVDIPVSNIEADVIADAVNAAKPGTAVSGGGKVTVNKSAFDKQADGSYILTYTTPVDSSLALSETKKNIKNKAEAEVEGMNYPGNEVSIEVGGIVGEYVNKQFVSADGKNITWEIDVSIPDTVEPITDFIVRDSTNAVWDAKGRSHFIDYTKLTINGSSDLSAYGDFTTDWDAKIDTSFIFRLKDEVVAANKGKTLKFRVTTEMQDKPDYMYINKGMVYFKLGTDDLSGEDTADYTSDLSMEKGKSKTDGYFLPTNGIYPLKWVVHIKASEGYKFHTGQVVEITDTLPEGYTLGDNVRYTCENDDWFTEFVPDSVTKTAVGDREQVTIRIKLTEAQAARANITNVIYLHYVTAMTPEYAKDFVKKPAGDYTFTNTASAKTEDIIIGEDTATQTVTIDPLNILNKSVNGYIDGDSGKAYADYTIEINKDAVSLVEGTTLTAVDKLGSKLSVVGGKGGIDVYIEGGAPLTSEVIDYDKTANTITLKLKDSTHYTVKYKVSVNQIYSDEEVTDAQVEEYFGNSIELTGAGAGFSPDKAVLNESTYRSTFTASSDDDTKRIKLSGEKTWTDSGKDGLRPKKIKIILKQNKFKPDHTFLESKNRVEEVEVNTVSGKWTYEITDLIVKDSEDNTYEYDIEEIEIDGYKANYTYNSEDETDALITGITDTDNKDHTLKIRNEFVADKIEVGSLKVNKVWEGIPGYESAVTFKLYDDEKLVGKKTLEAGETSVTFTNLPIYHYTKRNDDGSLKREPIIYRLEEEGYNAEHINTDAPMTVQLVPDGYDKKGKPSPAIEEEVTVTNTHGHNRYTVIKGTKTFVDTLHEDLRPSKITLVITRYKKAITDADFGAGTEYTRITVPIKGTVTEYATNKLLVLDEDGTQYKYSIAEAPVDGYKTTYVGATSDISIIDGDISALDITNTFDDSLGSIKVTKTWEGDTAATRKNVSFSLYDVTDGKEVFMKLLTLKKGSEYVQFDDIPVYKYTRKDDGTLEKTSRVYKIVEDKITDYVSDIDPKTFTITKDSVTDVAATNTYSVNKEYITIKGTKTFADAGRESLRPDKITLILTQHKNGGAGEDLPPINVPVTGDTFSFTTGDLIVKDSDGSTYKYDIKEATINDNYTVLLTDDMRGISSNTVISGISGKDGDVVTINIKNTFKEFKGSIRVTKTWDDPDDTYRTDVTFSLYDVEDLATPIATKVLAKGDSVVTFDNVPVFRYVNTDGTVTRTPAEYVVKENAPSGYTPVFTPAGNIRFTTSSTLPTTAIAPLDVGVTNTFEEYNGSLKVNKVWNDATDTSGRTDVTFSLYDVEDLTTPIDTKVLVNGETSVTFTNVPLFKYSISGGVITRTPAVYTVKESALTGYTTDIPASVKLVADGTVPTEPVVKEITATNTLDVTNDYIIIKGTKTFVDNGREALRPDKITLILTQHKNGGAGVDLAPINVSVTGGTFSFTTGKLLVKDTLGSTYTYDIKELEINDNYTVLLTDVANGISSNTVISGITGNDGDSVTVNITNTFKEYDGSLTVTKIWDDASDTSGRADVTFSLYDNDDLGTPIATKVLANGDTSVTFTGIPLFKYSKSGDTVTRVPAMYTLKESDLPGYTAIIPASVTLVSDGTLPTEAVTKSVEVTNKLKTSTPTETEPTTPTETEPTTPTETEPTTPTETEPTTPTETEPTTPTETEPTTPTETEPTTPTETEPTTPAVPTVTTPSHPTGGGPSPTVTQAPAPVVTTTTTKPSKTTTTEPEPEEDEDIEDDYYDDSDDDTTTPVEEEETPEIPDSEIDLEVSNSIEENPNTGTKLPTLFAAALFGAIAIIPSRKKKED